MVGCLGCFGYLGKTGVQSFENSHFGLAFYISDLMDCDSISFLTVGNFNPGIYFPLNNFCLLVIDTPPVWKTLREWSKGCI